MEKLKWNNWNSLRDFLEKHEEVKIPLTMHIDELRQSVLFAITNLLKSVAKKSYPKSLKEVKARKFKFKDKYGYYLLEEIKKDSDGDYVVPKLVWDRNKWIETNVSLLQICRREIKLTIDDWSM
jgi:hypothetical protein